MIHRIVVVEEECIGQEHCVAVAEERIGQEGRCIVAAVERNSGFAFDHIPWKLHKEEHRCYCVGPISWEEQWLSACKSWAVGEYKRAVGVGFHNHGQKHGRPKVDSFQT
jgi:hypothetical protein